MAPSRKLSLKHRVVSFGFWRSHYLRWPGHKGRPGYHSGAKNSTSFPRLVGELPGRRLIRVVAHRHPSQPSVTARSMHHRFTDVGHTDLSVQMKGANNRKHKKTHVLKYVFFRFVIHFCICLICHTIHNWLLHIRIAHTYNTQRKFLDGELFTA